MTPPGSPVRGHRVAAIGDRDRPDRRGAVHGRVHGPDGVRPVDVRLLILVAPMIPAPGDTPGAWWTNTGQDPARRQQDEAEDATRTPIRRRDGLLPRRRAGDRRRGIHPRGTAAVRHAVGPAMAARRVAERPDQVLAGRHDRLFPLPFMRRLALERLGVASTSSTAGTCPRSAAPRRSRSGWRPTASLRGRRRRGRRCAASGRSTARSGSARARSRDWPGRSGPSQAVDRVAADEVAPVDHSLGVRADGLGVHAEPAEHGRRRGLPRGDAVDPVDPAAARGAP